jgi:hypothetical protein
MSVGTEGHDDQPAEEVPEEELGRDDPRLRRQLGLGLIALGALMALGTVGLLVWLLP